MKLIYFAYICRPTVMVTSSIERLGQTTDHEAKLSFVVPEYILKTD